MALTTLTAEVANVSALSDQPNDNDGLSAAELKAVFDAAGVAIKTFLNDIHIPEVEAAINAAASGIALGALDGSMFEDGSISADKLSSEEGLEAVNTPNIRAYAITLEKLAQPLQTTLATLQSAVNTLNTALSAKVNYTQLANVALSGEYADLNNKPTIPVIDEAVVEGSTNGLQSRLIQGLVNEKAQTNHAVNANTYGLGSSNVYGHVKLSDSHTETSGAADGIAATPKAVKDAYDLANGKAPNSHVSQAATDTVSGHIKISTGTCTLSSGTKTWSGVALSGATCSSTSIVIVTPSSGSYQQWVDHGIRCTAQGSNTLSFAADTNTTSIVTVNVLVIKT